MREFKSIIRTRHLASVGLAVLAAATTLFLLTWFLDPKAEVVELRLRHEKEIIVGSPIICETIVRLPWFRWPLQAPEIDFDNDDAALVFSERPQVVRIGWGTWNWRFRGVIQAYRTGKIDNATMILHVLPPRRNDKTRLELTLPEFEVKSVLDKHPRTGELFPAPIPISPEPPPRFPWFEPKLIVLAAAIIVVIHGLFLTRSSRKKEKLSPKEKALKKLLSTNSGLKKNPNLTLVQLAEILTSYLGERFEIKTETKSAEELLKEIVGLETLTMTQVEFLHQILSSAEQVKFAGAEINPEQLPEIIEKTQQFIISTSPNSAKIRTETEF